MLPIQFIYAENGKEKPFIDEHERRCEIIEHNKRLAEEFPVYKKNRDLK